LPDGYADEYASVEYVVEANTFERHKLWEEWAWGDVQWKDGTSGSLITVGYMGDSPVVISILVANILGYDVIFWHPTSRVVDYQMIEAWLEKNVPVYQTKVAEHKSDAMNFHNCIHHLNHHKQIDEAFDWLAETTNG
jgi:hypothetical protein